MDGRGTLDNAAPSLGGAKEEVEGALDAASSLGGAKEEVSLGGAKKFKSASGERREEEYL